MSQILVFGASIAQGYWDIEGGWVQKLRKFVDKKFVLNKGSKTLVFNLGISGNTTSDLLSRFESEIKPRLLHKDTIIIFSVGLNDSQYFEKTKKFRTSNFQFRINLQRLFDIAKRFTSKILFVGINPVDETKTNPIPWDPLKNHKNIYIKKCNQIIKTVCKEKQIYFIDLFERFEKMDYKKLLFDGTHPNSAGHQKIFEIVKEVLIKQSII